MTTTVKFNNQFVLSRIEENKSKKNSLIIQELKIIAPLLNDIELFETIPYCVNNGFRLLLIIYTN